MELALILFGAIILLQTVAIVALVWLHAGKPRILPQTMKAPTPAPVEVQPKVAFYHGMNSGGTTPRGLERKP